MTEAIAQVILQVFSFSLITMFQWIFAIQITTTFHMFFNQNIINSFVIYKILQTYNPIFNIIIFIKIFSPSCCLLRVFFLQKHLFFLIFFNTYWQYLLTFLNVPNLINCCLGSFVSMDSFILVPYSFLKLSYSV